MTVIILLMNGKITQLRKIIEQSLIYTGVLRYNIVYIPKLNAYRITLVGSRDGVSGNTLNKLIDMLMNNGYIVRVKVGKTPFFNVIHLYVMPKVPVV